MRRLIYVFLFLIILGIYPNAKAFASQEIYLNDTKYSDNAYTVEVKNLEKNLKAIVYFDTFMYTYDLVDGENEIPLQFGNGTYEIKIAEHVIDTKYKVIEQLEFKVKEIKKTFVFSSKIVNMKNAKKLLKKKTSFIKSGMTDEEKINATYKFVTKLLSYDDEKAKTVADGYIPNIDKILKLKKGICYDYSVMMAIILRSEGIPTKLNMGYREDMETYHAWNEVYVNGKWKTIDATLESKKVYQDSSKYTITKFY